MAAVDSFDTKSFFFLFPDRRSRGGGGASAITPYVKPAVSAQSGRWRQQTTTNEYLRLITVNFVNNLVDKVIFGIII